MNLLLTRLQELRRRSGYRTMPGYFTNMVDQWRVQITHGRNRDAEDEWIDTHVQHPWARTRYEEHVEYIFGDEIEALHFKMMFG